MISIRRKLTIGLALGIAALNAAAFVVLFLYVKGVMYRQYDGELLDAARTFAATTEIGDEENAGGFEFGLSEASLPEYEDSEDAKYFQVRDASGESLLRSESLEDADLPFAELDPKGAAYQNISLPDGRPGRLIALAIEPRIDEEAGPDAARDAGTLHLSMAWSRTELDAAIARVLIGVLGGVSALTLFTALIVDRIVRKELAPLSRLAEETAAIGASDLSYRYDSAGLPDEIRPVTERLNELLGRLETAFERERRFNRNVAHELRTPVAELKTLAEVAMREAEAEDQSNVASASLTDVLDVANQMEELIGALLALSRSDSARETVTFEAVNLSQVLTDRIAVHRARFDRNQLTVAAEIADGVEVRTNAILMTAIIDNLLANAGEYTAPGGEITVALTDHPNETRLTISNTASLKAEDLPLLFEPFWRGDHAHTDRAHAGLGLSVVHSFADSLGIQVVASIAPDGDLLITLTIPRAQT